MNYAKMIEILEWVKAARNDRDTYGLGTSPYICDNVSRFPGDDSDRYDAVKAIRSDIRARIHNCFGVPEFLGYNDSETRIGQDPNYFPDVVAYRDAMVADLIARYTAAMEVA